MASPSAQRPAKPAWADPGAVASAALFLGAVLLAYLPALRGGLLWDDDAHVTAAGLRSLHGLWRIWFDIGATQQFYPVLHSAFWVEHRLWGDSVAGYHLANVLLHAAAAWLLSLCLRRLSFPAPVLAGLVFALHPVCVESVAWISEQKNTLSAVFYLGSALLYLGFDSSRSRARYAGALALFAAALLTKSVTATLPAALLVVLWWRRGSIARRDVVPLAPWFIVGAVSGLFTAWAEARLIGAEGADFSLSPPARLVLAGRSLMFYLGKALWPSNLSFIYPRRVPDPGPIAQWVPLAAALAILAVLARYRSRSRGPLAGYLFFAGTLFPVLGFVNVYPFLFSFVADHFQYLASIGVIVPATWALWGLSERIPARPIVRGGILLAVPVFLGALSWRQAGTYRSAETLYRDTLGRNPSAWLMHYNLAVALGERPGMREEAVLHYRETLRLKPDHWAAHNNLGSALLETPGRSAEAASEFESALRINPGFADAHNNLGVVLGHVPGRAREAEAHLRTAIRIRPDYDGAHNNLGVLLMAKPGALGEAIAQFGEALRLAPDNAEYHFNLANALSLDPGMLADAEAEYRAALRLRPGYVEAHSNLGAALARTPGRLGDAVLEYREALRLSPGAAAIHANLANALARLPGRAADSVAEYSEAIRLDPSDPQAHNALGVVLSDMPGRLPQAVAEFEAAVQLDPGSEVAQFCLGVGLARIGRPAEAAAHLEEALRIRPDFEEARRALGRLKPAGR